MVAVPTRSREPPFVGRERELATLGGLLDAARAGHGGLALVAGEPGIGKTALCRWFAALVATRGGRILVGHCAEASAASLAYLPFVEALRGYILTRDPEVLATELGETVVELARLVPEVRARVPLPVTDPLPVPAGPEEACYRLLQGVSGFLARAAVAAPLVLVLEDLHDADRGTLDLMGHLARVLADSRLLVVGTYRDIAVDRGHPLSATITAARRHVRPVRLHLHGLNADDVHRLAERVCGHDLPAAVANEVYLQSEGNPLFVEGDTRELVSLGLVGADGRTGGGDAPWLGIPDELREVIEQRLARLHDTERRVLAVAAVLGRTFALHDLPAASDQSEEAVVTALDAGVRLGVLQETAGGVGVGYRFAHALFRQALEEGLSAARRAQLHRRIGHMLAERWAGHEEEHTAELAAHFLRSPDPADLGQAVTYCEQAAWRATAVYAHAEAVRLLDQALAALAASSPTDDARRCDLLLTLGLSLAYSGQPDRAIEECAPAAYALAERLADPLRASFACSLVFWSLHAYRSLPRFYATPWPRGGRSGPTAGPRPTRCGGSTPISSWPGCVPPPGPMRRASTWPRARSTSPAGWAMPMRTGSPRPCGSGPPCRPTNGHGRR